MNFKELLKSSRPPKKDEITDEDLAKLYMKYRGLLKQQEREEAFSAATHENIRIAYAKVDKLVEDRTAELRKTNEQLRRDITERKRAVEELRLERDNLIKIFEAMEDGVYIVNQQYNIQYVNTALKKDFGPHEDRKCYEYFHDRKEVCPWCKNQDVFAGKTVRWEWFSFKNQKTYDLIDTPVRNPDGTISKLEIFRDITDRRKAEEELKEHREHLEELVKKRTAELQSIINSMSGREIRMAELKEAIQKLREQIESAGLTPVADDPLKEMAKETAEGSE